MSMLQTKKWDEGMKANLPSCPACGGEIEYGYLASKESIHWASDISGDHFSGIEEALSWAPKKPIAIPISRCSKCRIMITVLPD